MCLKPLRVFAAYALVVGHLPVIQVKHIMVKHYLNVAQFGRVVALEASGRRFKSYHSDQFAGVAQLAEAADLDSAQCRFKSYHQYQIRAQLPLNFDNYPINYCSIFNIVGNI